MAHDTKVPDEGDVVNMKDGKEGNINADDPAFIEDNAWTVGVTVENDDYDEDDPDSDETVDESDVTIVWKDGAWHET